MGAHGVGPMHVRESKVRKGGKVYRYVQLVQSYRRADGTPAHRVLASFGDLSAAQTASVRTFAKAMSMDVALAAVDAIGERPPDPVRVLANLEYLPLAVLLEVWERSGLAALVRRALGAANRDISDADIVTALVLHRCVNADSKLAAERWFPTTALPELFGWSPAKFNNSRVHRALETLEARDEDLQRELPGVLRNEYGPFSVLLVDGTDTWFEGEGPEIASMGRVKDGTYRRKILIVVACDSRGFPLCWDTFEGGKSEVHALQEVVTKLGSCAWVQEAPIVADRALGNHASIEVLSRTGRRFLVAVPEHEIPSWVPTLDGLPLDLDPEDGRAIANAVVRIGMERVDDRTYVVDGRELALPIDESAPALDDARETETRPAEGGTAEAGRNVELLALARTLEGGGSHSALAAQLGRSKSFVRKLLALRQLPDDVRARIAAGEARDVAFSALAEIVHAHPEEHGRRTAFDALVAADGRKGRVLPRRMAGKPAPAVIRPPRQRRDLGRPIVYFNPEMFAAQRRRAAADLCDIQRALDALDRNAATQRDNDVTLLGKVDRLLRHHDAVSLFEVQIVRIEGAPVRIRTTLRKEVWHRRRRFDGFSLLVADLLQGRTPAELVALYRSRECIERGFRTIKSTVELRPVHHRTDAKVRAHVTICVLATLLQRLLEHHLAKAGATSSAERALATLAACHLNTVSTGSRSTHTVTALEPDVRGLLAKLDLDELASDEHVRARIVPR